MGGRTVDQAGLSCIEDTSWHLSETEAELSPPVASAWTKGLDLYKLQQKQADWLRSSASSGAVLGSASKAGLSAVSSVSQTNQDRNGLLDDA